MELQTRITYSKPQTKATKNYTPSAYICIEFHTPRNIAASKICIQFHINQATKYTSYE